MLRHLIILLFSGLLTFFLRLFVKKPKSRSWYTVEDKSGSLGFDPISRKIKSILMKSKKAFSFIGLDFLLFMLIMIFLVEGGKSQKPPNLILGLDTSNPDSITSISLKSRGLTSFPQELLQFKNLKILDLSDNNINKLPAEIKQFSKLQFLDISENNIQRLPSTFSTLSNLSTVYLGGNKMLDVAQVLDVFPSSKIQVLDLQYDNIESLPDNIGKLKNLRKLILSGNPIRRLPNSLTELDELQVLYLNNDPFFDVKKNISTLKKLKALRELHLEEDNLTYIPEELMQLENLQYLYLNRNRLSSFPSRWEHNKSLKYLDVSGNPLPRMQIEGFENRLAPTLKINFGN